MLDLCLEIQQYVVACLFISEVWNEMTLDCHVYTLICYLASSAASGEHNCGCHHAGYHPMIHSSSTRTTKYSFRTRVLLFVPRIRDREDVKGKGTRLVSVPNMRSRVCPRRSILKRDVGTSGVLTHCCCIPGSEITLTYNNRRRVVIRILHANPSVMVEVTPITPYLNAGIHP